MFKSKVLIYLLLLFSVAVWGMSFVWTGQLLNFGFPPISIVFFRLLIAALFIVLVSVCMGKLQWPNRKDIGLFLLMALFEPFLYFVGETFGIQRTSPTLASVIVSTIPLFSPFVGYYLYREKISIANFAGIVISIAGVCLVIFHRGGETGLTLDGFLLLGLAIISAIFYSAVVKKLSDRYNPYTIVCFQNSLGALYFLPLFLLVDYKSVGAISFTWGDIMPLLMLSILASGIAFIFFVSAIARLGMTRANMFITLIPVLTAVFSFILGLETLTILRVMGIVTVIAGLILSQRRVKKGDNALLKN